MGVAEQDQPPTLVVRENIYGHLGRLEYLKRFIPEGAAVLEFGCGTGCMITLPLLLEGYDMWGVDLDESSINYGREIFQSHQCAPDRLLLQDVEDLDRRFDVIIASEVLEHIPDEQLDDILTTLLQKLKPGGRLLATVPNGYGWFEAESFMWFKTGIGRFLEWSRLTEVWFKLKYSLIGVYVESPYFSSLSGSPHVQRFTAKSIRARLQKHGLQVIDQTGTVLVAGPFSNILFTGFRRVMATNKWLGQRFPKIAAGFMIAAEKP